jgi:hypothetical protein
MQLHRPEIRSPPLREKDQVPIRRFWPTTFAAVGIVGDDPPTNAGVTTVRTYRFVRCARMTPWVLPADRTRVDWVAMSA